MAFSNVSGKIDKANIPYARKLVHYSTQIQVSQGCNDEAGSVLLKTQTGELER